ncbi:MAG: hypothetical protein HY748_03590 [Elusimicrobia bacterium]|nr:hypothetical protein [Elusimicrobiota bacterium]
MLAQFLPGWLAGFAPFWGDLTYLHHPWRALPAQLVQAGRLPLWNPYIYFGMPMAASMQGAPFYPLTLPFFLFPFPTALSMFHLFHYWLAGWLMFLWLRSMRLSMPAALAGGVAYCLGGLMFSRMQFLNHLAVLSLAPALLLFFDRVWLLALSLALSFFAGYPVFLPGLALCAWAIRLVLMRTGAWAGLGRDSAVWLAAGAAALALTGCVLLPALELASLCRRSAGMGLSETLSWGFEPRDWVQWVSPLLAPLRSFDPASGWWKCCYLGFAGWLAAVLAPRLLGRRKAMGLAAIVAATAVLVLGGSTAVSLAVWKHAPALRFVRYPGNLSYLAWPALAVLTSAGIEALRRAGRGRGRGRGAWALVLAAAVAVELSAYAFGAMPLAGRDLFSSAGPLVRRLQGTLGADRYLLSPRALESNKGWGVRDWKWRLYGLTNAPFRLPAAGNFGEPLVPKGSYEFMDFLYNQPGAEPASRFFKWAGIGALLTPEEVPAGKQGALRHEGRTLWELYRFRGASRAYWLEDAAGAALPEGLPAGLPAAASAIKGGARASRPPSGKALAADGAAGMPLTLRWLREDMFRVEGEAPRQGWAYIAEPFYPGWKVFLETSSSFESVRAQRALAAFQKVRVPSGPFKLHFRYDPLSWKLGAALTLACLMGFCLYWYNRRQAPTDAQ